MIVVGTAGWSIPRGSAADFPGEGSHLHRYSRLLVGAEINSSFHRPHARSVYERWAATVPAAFRFAVKMPRAITHDRRLRRARAPLTQFLEQATGLGGKLGPLLVQLPPSFEFEARVANTFFTLLRELHGGAVVCEPRHPTWFGGRADSVFTTRRIGRVATDPSPIDGAQRPGGWTGGGEETGVVYYRLHGSPRMYWSSYPRERIAVWARQLAAYAAHSDVWCVFDNTASGAAAANALAMLEELGRRRRPVASGN